MPHHHRSTRIVHVSRLKAAPRSNQIIPSNDQQHRAKIDPYMSTSIPPQIVNNVQPSTNIDLKRRNPTPKDTNITKNTKCPNICCLTTSILFALISMTTLAITIYLFIYINQRFTSILSITTTAPTPGWSNTDSMYYARVQHTSSLLTNGNVLVTGGNNGIYLNTAELYNPSTGVWTNINNMNYARSYHTASVLLNGNVLVVGGYSTTSYLNNAELYDPSTGIWTMTGNMSVARGYHRASVLTNGKVLVVGGWNGLSLNQSELYDTLTGIWTVSYMNHDRRQHAQSVLTNGQVLVIGGIFGYANGCTNDTKLYQP